MATADPRDLAPQPVTVCFLDSAGAPRVNRYVSPLYRLFGEAEDDGTDPCREDAEDAAGSV